MPLPNSHASKFGLKLYDANRINRNQLIHFAPSSLAGNDMTRLKGPRFNPEHTAFPGITQQPRGEQKRWLRRMIEKHRKDRKLLDDPATDGV
jgi:hypothetical protein